MFFINIGCGQSFVQSSDAIELVTILWRNRMREIRHAGGVSVAGKLVCVGTMLLANVAI